MTKCLRLLLLTAIVALCSCSGGPQSLLPKSGGRPYEVLLVASDRRCAAVVDSVLTQDMPSLPQREPMFDVSLIDTTRFNQTTRLARCIVIVTVNPAVFTSTRIRYEKTYGQDRSSWYMSTRRRHHSSANIWQRLATGSQVC